MITLLCILVAGAAAVYIIAPLLGWGASRPAFETVTASRSRRDELIDQRREILAGIKDLDLEYEVGKLTREDYEQIRESLSRQAIEIYREMDRYGRA